MTPEEQAREIALRHVPPLTCLAGHGYGRCQEDHALLQREHLSRDILQALAATRVEGQARGEAIGFHVSVADVTNDAATLAECGKLKQKNDALRAQLDL